MSDWSEACDPVPARRELTDAEKRRKTVKTKRVEVYRVEYASNGVPSILNLYTRDGADAWVRGAEGLPYIACIRVTGPHKQRVPA